MGSYHGAELCELSGIFTQSVLQDIINKEAIGLYRDDGLIVLNEVISQNTDKFRKKTIHVFRDNGFSTDIVTKLVEVNFLDVTFNLRKGTSDLIKSRMMSLRTSMSCPTTHPRF